MRIAYLSSHSPHNIHVWSGTPYHVFQSLQKYHDVVWIGGGVIDGARWCHILRGRTESFHPEYYNREVGRFLSKQINDGNFDVVITCTYHFCVSLDVAIPVIFYSDVTFHLFQHSFNNKDPHYHQLAYHTEQRCLERADAIVYASEWARHDAIVHYQIPEQKIHVIEFGANIPDPEDIQMKSTKMDVCHLVFVGKNWNRKRGSMMLEIYKILKKQGFPCSLTIIGSTPPNGYQDDITIYPWLDKSSPKDLACYDQILRNSHFLVLPTEFDAYGIVFCEASAYGVPSIAPNVGGVNQPIRNGVNGILFSPTSTADDYAKTIQTVFEDRSLYLKLRKNALEEYKTRLNWDTWCLHMTELMEKLVEKKNDSSQKSFYLPVYAINLPKRADRRLHLEEQFKDKDEFCVTYVEAVQHIIGAVGLWESMKKAVRLAIERDEDIIAICEDDHTFTSYYKKDYFIRNLVGAYRQGAELLSGGIGGFGHAVPVGNNRYWVDWFYCTQFIIITKKLFQKILDYPFTIADTADGVLSKLAEEKQTLFPFISTQKDFGYSDVTQSNNVNKGQIENLFQKTQRRLLMIHQVFHNHAENVQ